MSVDFTKINFLVPLVLGNYFSKRFILKTVLNLVVGRVPFTPSNVRVVTPRKHDPSTIRQKISALRI